MDPCFKHTHRLEIKNFDVGAGVDYSLIRLAIIAVWAMLDDPRIIDRLHYGFNKIAYDLDISIADSDFPKDFHGVLSNKERVYGCLVDQRPVVREMVARALSEPAMTLREQAHGIKWYKPRANKRWHQMMQASEQIDITHISNYQGNSDLSFTERATQHPFARIAAKIPEPKY